MNEITSESEHRLLAPMATVPACQRLGGEADWFPPVDILEDAEAYVFKIDLPEMKPKDIRVVVERDGLFISGERPKLAVADKRFLRVERPHGYFERRFALPDDASRIEIQSLLEDSVLELHVRKVSPIKQNPTTADTPPSLKVQTAP